MSEIKLKPCPFCGKPAAISRDGDRFWVSCTHDCDIESYETKSEAVERWNNRPIEDALQERIRELTAQCNQNYEPLRQQLEQQALELAQVENAYSIELGRLNAELDAAKGTCVYYTYEDINGDVLSECRRCGLELMIIDGDVEDNNYQYCPGCGAKIERFESDPREDLWEDRE